MSVLGGNSPIYSISRSLLQSIAAARSGSAAVAAARGRAASVVVLAVARHRALVGSIAVGVILLYAAFLAQLSVAPSLTGAKVLHFSYTTKNHLAELCEIPLTFLP